MPTTHQHENNGTESRFILHYHHHYLHYKTMLIVTVISGLIFFSFSALMNANRSDFIAYAQIANGNINEVFPDNGPNTDRPPAFLDSYWTDNLSANSSVPTNVVKKEVGPDDGTSTLAIVLVNRGRSDITGVTGYLDLPVGFKPIAGKNNGSSQSVGSSYSVVKAGNTFVIYFDMEVLKQAKVGGYSTSLNLKYSKILQMGQLTTTITVPFRLTGRAILDTVPENKELIPGSPNQLKVNIQNKGSANATAVVVTITGVTGNSVNSGGVIASSGNIIPANANSNATTTTTVPQQPSSSSSTMSSSSSSPLSIPTINLASQTFNVGSIPANSSVQITPTIYPISSAGETAQNLNLQISYGDAYGSQKTTDAQVGLVIAPNPPQSVLNLTANNGNALILTSGKIQDIGFTLENNDKKSITNVVASLNSESDSMKILGDSRWTIPSMLPQSKLNLSTKVFASSNIIGQPTLFTLTVQYVSVGQSKTDSLNLGAYITGEIKIAINDVAINYIGGVPNLVGSLLNQGNTQALFTTIELVQNPFSPSHLPDNQSLAAGGIGNKSTNVPRSSSDPSSQRTSSSSRTASSSLPPPQYLGDLDADSPLPFSIPLDLILNNNTSTGVYPVSFKVTYSDDLKYSHDVIINKTVPFKQPQRHTTNEGLNFFDFVGGGSSISGRGRSSPIFGIGFPMIVIIAAIITAIAIFFIFRKRRKSRAQIYSKSDSDIETFLDDSRLLDRNKDAHGE
jgi:hypothetical protein